MSRSAIVNPTADLQSDSGSVLWSLVRGEQLEFPITLSFLENASIGYTYEAVVVEADNVADQTSKPSVIKAGGVQTTLVVRVPVYKNTWTPATAYNREDVVLYSGLYYKLASGAARVSATLPDIDPLWEVHVPNKVYIQFPSALGSTWALTPTATTSTYGFFELRVTEPSGGVYQKTWKPMRGMVEMLFSPTDIVA